MICTDMHHCTVVCGQCSTLEAALTTKSCSAVLCSATDTAPLVMYTYSQQQLLCIRIRSAFSGPSTQLSLVFSLELQ